MRFPGTGHGLRDQYAYEQSACRGPGWRVRYRTGEGTGTVTGPGISHRSGTYGPAEIFPGEYYSPGLGR